VILFAYRREAETLDFRPKNRAVVTTNSMVNKFQAKNDFEREIQEALEMSGMGDEKGIMEREDEWGGEEGGEDDDLGRNKMTVEEFKKRHGQLAKMRSLLFYEER